MKILLVEDNRAISKGLVYTLEQNGFEVALCENAESTLNSLGGDFDLFAVTLTFLLLMYRFPTATALSFVTR